VAAGPLVGADIPDAFPDGDTAAGSLPTGVPDPLSRVYWARYDDRQLVRWDVQPEIEEILDKWENPGS